MIINRSSETEIVFRTNTEEATRQFAKQIATYLQAGDVLTLSGDLGAGKTTFTQGLAQGLDINERVNSPTFTIIKEYEGRLPLYHMDIYRLEGSEEELGLEEYFEGDGVSVVEWASIISEQIPKEHLEIRITHLSLDEREITLIPHGSHFEKICEELKHAYSRN